MKSLDQCSKFQILDKDRTWIDVQMVQLEPGDVYRRLHPTSGLPDPQFGLPEKRIVKKGPYIEVQILFENNPTDVTETPE